MRQGQTRLVRPAVQLGALVTCLFWLDAVSWAPNPGLAETEGVPASLRVPAAVDPSPLVLDASQVPSPRIRARAAVVYNPRTHEILWQADARERRPIASITKVMTALVFLDEDPDLTRDVVVSRNDVRRASTTYLRQGERVRLRDLLHLALVASDNAAARVLARVSSGGTVGFIERMNQKAVALGLAATSFADPSGLNRWNLSTAYDVARLITHASQQPTIAGIMKKRSHRMTTSRRRLTVRNTNRLLEGRLPIQAGKTGYIDLSGYCLAAVVEGPDGEPLTFVVLGVGSNAGRFRDVRRLVDWVDDYGRSLVSPRL